LQKYALLGAFTERYSLILDGNMTVSNLPHSGTTLSPAQIFAEAHRVACERKAEALCIVLNLKLLQVNDNKDCEIWDSIFVVAQSRLFSTAVIQPIRVHQNGELTFVGLTEATWDTTDFGEPEEIFPQLDLVMTAAKVPGLPHMPSHLLH
jgi:hypothetical protein